VPAEDARVSRARAVDVCVLVLVLWLPSCGARTPLRIGDDAGVPSFDAGPHDASGRPDAGPIDVGPPDSPSPCRGDRECDDGLFCTGEERCSGGICVSAPFVCPSDPCRDGLCDESRDLCVVRPSPRADSDGDGSPSIACGGSDCDDTNATISPMAFESCTNGRDDDCDALVDCIDDACTGHPACARENCTNGRDDDRDGLADCADPDCRMEPTCAPSCVTTDLASAMGFSVARGTTVGTGDDLMGSCGSSTGPDLAFTWTAPISATYVFDTIDSVYDTVLYVRDVSCTGRELACDDDAAGMLQSRVMLDLRAGQVVVIVVDGFGGAEGEFELDISASSETGLCANGADDDLDGASDCADMDCAGRPPC
jgi:hypothetical protein